MHVEQNAAFADCFLPAHLGWWAVKTWHGFDAEPTYSDDLAYLCTKAIAHDVGISLIGMDPHTMKTVPACQRLAKIIREHEALRHSGELDEAVKKRLAQPGKDYDLFQDGSGRWCFREVQYKRFMIGGSNRAESIHVVNPFHQQPAKMRMEVLHTISDDATTNGVPLIDFSDFARLGNPQTAEGVRMQIGPTPDREKNESLKDIPCGKFVLSRRDAMDRKASWAGTTVPLEPRLDLSKHQGFGCWVWGDGSGALLNIQLRGPHHISNGIGEHYVDLDFNGWRFIKLAEPEGERWSDYQWPYGDPYSIYRENVHYSDVASIGIWFNDLPAGRDMQCRIGPVRALPLIDDQISTLELAVISAPEQKPIVLQTDLKTGEYAELDASGNWIQYDRSGKPIGENRLESLPELQNGDNEIKFSIQAPPNAGHPRIRVTFICYGDPI